MEPLQNLRAIVDENGQLVLPPEIRARLGLVPGTEILLENTVGGTTLRRAATHLAKVYVEPSSRCNLKCTICIRHSWTETQGDMTGETFGCLLESLSQGEFRPVICFGGFGEPLLHPNIIELFWQSLPHLRCMSVGLGSYSMSLINPDCRNFPSNGASYEE